MIPSKRKNKLFDSLPYKIGQEPYLVVNIAFALVIVLVIAYSLVFSPEKDNYPVVCMHEKLSGQPCFSCGLSHSFSLIVRGRISEAYEWNRFGMQVFIFFALQLILRIVFPAYYLLYPGNRRQLILLDIAGSGLLFLIAFRPFLENLARSLFQVI